MNFNHKIVDYRVIDSVDKNLKVDSKGIKKSILDLWSINSVSKRRGERYFS